MHYDILEKMQTTHIRLDYNDIYPDYKVTFDEIISLIRDFNSTDFIKILTIINIILHNDWTIPTIKSEKELSLIKTIFPNDTFQKIYNILLTKKADKVIDRQILLNAILLSIQYSRSSTLGLRVKNNEFKIGEILLKLNSVIINNENKKLKCNGTKEGIYDKILPGIIYQQLIFNNINNFATSLGRNFTIFTKGFRNVKLAHPNEYFDFENRYIATFGYKFEHLISFGIWLWAKYEKLEANFTLDVNYLNSIKDPSLRKKCLLILNDLSDSIINIKTKFKSIYNNIDKPILNFAPFNNRPFIKIESNKYIPVDFDFIENRLTDGIFWSLNNSLNSQEEQNRLSTSYGRAFEWYASEIVKNTFRKNKLENYWLDWNNEIPTIGKDKKSVDIIIKEVNTLFLIEVTKTSLSSNDSLKGDSDILEKRIHNIWFKKGKILQLFEVYQHFFQNPEFLPQIKRHRIKNVVPILLVLKSIPQDFGLKLIFYNNILNNFYFEGVKLSKRFIKSLEFLNIEEFENLASLKVVNGENWRKLYIEKIKYHSDSSFSNFLFNTYRSKPDFMPMLKSQYDSLFSHCLDFFKNA